MREECPWDREQDARSIVSHTVEEAYELADAAASGDDAKLLDELGDVLFQVYFLALLLEERGTGDLGQVAEQHMTKLVRRHPHVFGEVEAENAAQVLENWDRIKRSERDGQIFGEIPETLPATLHARKLQVRGARAGAGVAGGSAEALTALRTAVGEAPDPDAERAVRVDYVGNLLFDAVDVARTLDVDPELALRAAAERFRTTREAAQ